MAAGLATSADFQTLLWPGLRKIFFESYTAKEEQYSKYFHVTGSKKYKEEDFRMVGIGLWPTKQNNRPTEYESIDPAQSITYTHTVYSKGVQIERELVDDEMYNEIDKVPRSLGRTGRLTVEYKAIEILDNGATVNGYDGVPLFSDSHPLQKSATLGDNKLTLVLDDVNLKAALILSRKQVDDNGFMIQCNPKVIFVGVDNEFKALTLIQSSLTAGTGNNDANVIKGRLRVETLDLLADADSWYLQDPELHGLYFFWRVRPEFNQEKNFDTDIAKYRGYLRCSQGYSDWRGMLASIPA